MNPFIITRYGHQINFLRPQASEIDIRDIAHSLSRVCRFNAHTRVPYHVGQHVCLASDYAPVGCKREAFAHDWSEYACADLPAPLKALVPQYLTIEARLERVLAHKFHYRYPYPSAVKEIDMRLLVSEMRDLTNRTDWKTYPFTPLDEHIEPWDSEKCRREFMKRFCKLFL